MTLYDNRPGRGLEILVGLITSVVALLFWGLVGAFIIKARLELLILIPVILLILTALWFSQLSYRLLFNQRNKAGGLLSSWSLKVWCVLLGVGSILITAYSLYQGDMIAAACAIPMLIGCLYGLGVAKRRALSR